MICLKIFQYTFQNVSAFVYIVKSISKMIRTLKFNNGLSIKMEWIINLKAENLA